MRRLPIPPVFLISMVLLVLVGGCSDDDPAQPQAQTYPGILGVVVDSEGVPQESVSVGLIYDLPGVVSNRQHPLIITDPAEKPSTEISFEIPEPGNVRLWITDYAGDFVITLIDENFPAGNQAVMWQGLDEAGDPVPSGMYYYHLQIDDQEPVVHDLFLLFLDPADFLRSPNAVTDQDGVFRIPDTLIPVGATMTLVDESGEIVDEITITDVIRIRAVRDGDSGPEWGGLTINYLAGGGNGELEIVLP